MEGFIENIFSLDGLNLIIWAIYIGFMLAMILNYYQKKVIGAFVRSVIEQGALTSDSAKTLEELGYHGKPLIRRELAKYSALRKMVWEVDDNYRTGEDGTLYCAREKTLDLNLGKFYIPEERRIQAQLRYDDKGSDIFALIISAAVLFALAVVACIWLPGIIAAIHLY